MATEIWVFALKRSKKCTYQSCSGDACWFVIWASFFLIPETVCLLLHVYTVQLSVYKVVFDVIKMIFISVSCPLCRLSTDFIWQISSTLSLGSLAGMKVPSADRQCYSHSRRSNYRWPDDSVKLRQIPGQCQFDVILSSATLQNTDRVPVIPQAHRRV